MKQLHISYFNGNQWNQSYATKKIYTIKDEDVLKFYKLYLSGQMEYSFVIGNREFKKRFDAEYFYITDVIVYETLTL